MVPSAFRPRRTSRLDTPMEGISTRTGGDGWRARAGRVEDGAATVVVVGAVVAGGAVAGDAPGRAGGSPHAPRTRTSVSDASPAATRRSAGTPAQQHPGAEPGQGDHGRPGKDHAHARGRGAGGGPAGAGGDPAGGRAGD